MANKELSFNDNSLHPVTGLWLSQINQIVCCASYMAHHVQPQRLNTNHTYLKLHKRMQVTATIHDGLLGYPKRARCCTEDP